MDMPKILVVDDEEDLCEILKFNLEIEGYEVDTAFLRMLAILNPDISPIMTSKSSSW